MFPKISYELLSPVIDHLYDHKFPDGTSEEVIARYCEDIAQTIENAGWTTDDYMREYMSHDLKDLNPEFKFHIDSSSN